MKSALLLLSLIAGRALAATCNADNCARAVTGTFRSLAASRSADCVSFQACTVTPAPDVETAYVTETVTPQRKREASPAVVEQKRAPTTDIYGDVTVCPSVVPTYASACSGAARYASACSCGGAKPSTTTLAQATTTTTLTTYAPAAPTMPAGAQPNANGPKDFFIQVGVDMYDEYDFWFVGNSGGDDNAAARELRGQTVLFFTDGPGTPLTDYNSDSASLELRNNQGHSSVMHFDGDETREDQAATGHPYPLVYYTFGPYDYNVGYWTVLLYSNGNKTIVEYDPADDEQILYLSDRPTPGFVQPTLYAADTD